MGGHTAGAVRAGDAARPDEPPRWSDQYLAVISHEMRSPLTSIISSSELLRGEADGLSQNGLHYLDIIDRNADRLLKLVSDLLTQLRIESGAMVLDVSDVDIQVLVAEAVAAALPVAAKQDVTLHLDLGAPSGPPVRGDQQRLAQVVDNLIGNAIKFSRPGGLVRVTARVVRRPAAWRIDVSDTGIGIPPDETGRLFGRFERGTNARAAGLPGSGLGLPIVKVLTEMHGGHVEVDSVLDEGSTFSVFLPVTPSGRQARQAQQARQTPRA